LMRRVRASTVEPTFGLLKQRFGFRQVTLRGKELVNSQWQFSLATLNILKLALFRMDKAAVKC
ncbi:transposase, partial [Arthrospira platensis SPKY1]|nr:transposase [Arthrospira platensis SPKY1]